MTIVFSGGSDKYLVMANDSAVARDFASGHVEFEKGRKCFALDGVGVVTMWGDRSGNHLIKHLESRATKAPLHDVEDLAQTVHRYLTETYAPHTGDIADTGYHVGGFTLAGEMRLYHIYWNAPGSGNAPKDSGVYTFEPHHLAPNMMGFMYNGRHDIASRFMQTLIEEVNRGGNRTNFPWTPSGVCRLAHFILRASSEISKDVAPPFVIHVLSPSRRCIRVPVDEVIPSTDLVFAEALRQAGIE
jgi:hypothetical protein